MTHLGDQRAGAAKMGHTPDEFARPAFHMVPPDPMGSSRDAFTRISRHIGLHGLDLTAARLTQGDLRDERVREHFAGPLSLTSLMPGVERDLLRLQHTIVTQQGGDRDGSPEEIPVHGEFVLDHAIRNRHADSLEQSASGCRNDIGLHSLGDHAAGAWANGVLADGKALSHRTGAANKTMKLANSEL